MTPGARMKKRMILSSTLFLILFIIGCDVDHGIEPLKGRLEANIIFTGQPPEDTEGIYLTVAPLFPPHAINEMFHSPNSIPLDQSPFQASLDLPYGHYDAFIIWWYSKKTKSNLADILYILPDNHGNPQSFDITKENPVFHIDRLDLTPEILNRPSALKGTIQFNGPFPSNTWVTAIAAYSFEPSTGIQYLMYLNSIDFSVGPTSENYHPADNTYTFNLPVRNRITVQYIAVFWLPEQSDITDFRVLGTFDFSQYSSPYIFIRDTTTIEGLDIQADWSHAH